MKQNIKYSSRLPYENKIFVDKDRNVIITKKRYKIVCSKEQNRTLIRRVYVDDNFNLEKCYQ